MENSTRQSEVHDQDASVASQTGARHGNWVASLQRFIRGVRTAAEEFCDLCAAPIAPHHSHLVEPEKQRLLCVCPGCNLLLGDRQDKRYREVPERPRVLESFRLSDAEWDGFGIPIGLAYFFYSTREGRILAFYPGPAGPTESLLDLATWSQLVESNPELGRIEDDVEALLVNRVKDAREYFIVPIDRCYALVGLIRTHWRGVSGGDEAWNAIAGFFDDLRQSGEIRGHG